MSYGKMSARRNVPRWKNRTAKYSTAKCPYGKVSLRQNVPRRSVPRQKSHGEMTGHDCRYLEMSLIDFGDVCATSDELLGMMGLRNRDFWWIGLRLMDCGRRWRGICWTWGPVGSVPTDLILSSNHRHLIMLTSNSHLILWTLRGRLILSTFFGRLTLSANLYRLILTTDSEWKLLQTRCGFLKFST